MRNGTKLAAYLIARGPSISYSSTRNGVGSRGIVLGALTLTLFDRTPSELPLKSKAIQSPSLMLPMLKATKGLDACIACGLTHVRMNALVLRRDGFRCPGPGGGVLSSASEL